MNLLRALFRRAKGGGAAIERRASARVRTRLRPGKILHRTGVFLADCSIVERSHEGLRLRSFGPAGDVGDTVVVFDEQEAVLRPGRVVWSRGTEAGIRIDGEAARADTDLVRRLAGPYYAVTD